MVSCIKSLAVSSIAVTISLGVVDAWSASLTLFEHSDFHGASHTQSFTGKDSYTCYRLDCFPRIASSARWSGIPKLNAIGGPIHIQFYTDNLCNGGTMKRWKSTDNFPTNFQIDGINDQIYAFKITEISDGKKGTKGCDKARLLSDVTANATEAIVQCENAIAPHVTN